MGEIVYLNGKLVPSNKASVSIDDRGLLYGDGVFETLRTYHKVPFRLNAHLDRMYQSLESLDINLAISPAELKKAVYEVLKANDFKEAVIRITVTRGNSKKRKLYESSLSPNIIIKVSEHNPYDDELYQRGVCAVTVEDMRGTYCHLKSLNYLPNVLARKYADSKGAFEAILVTRRGFVTEGTISNVFAVIDDIIMTPPADKKVLGGVTRHVVIELAKGLGFRVEEDALIGQDLFQAKEVFLTNSLMEVMPVNRVNDSPVGSGQPGQIATQLIETYRRYITSWLDKLLTPKVSIKYPIF